MKALYLIAFILISVASYSQVEDGCISINFETLPSQQPSEGLTIRDQFRSSFGLSFSLDNGSFPVLAEVGGTTTAFGSSEGNDTPIPTDIMGRYFLTDDGLLSGLISPAIILDFETPIDSFSGCIVDIDLSEQFVIHALNANDQIILADTISDGDPGTGDGLLTCWGFNLQSCDGTGSISSIVFAGSRTQPGAFGLGLDSLTFCYTGFNIETDLSDATCSELGYIDVNSSTVEEYEYSIDGINFSNDGFFDQLDPGSYIIYIRDSDGCESTPIPFVIDPAPESIISPAISSTTCGDDNGQVIIDVTPVSTATYSLDGITYQSENVFLDMVPGAYTITVRDSFDCFYTEDIVIEPSVSPTLDSATTTVDLCSDSRGSILIEGSNGAGITAPLEYTINNNDYTENNLFSNLSTGGYIISVRDTLGCLASDSVFIDSTPEVLVRSIDVTIPDCYTENGIIEILAAGGTGIIEYEVNGMVQLDSTFNELPYGNYELLITDELGCSYTDTITILAPICPIYIPNVFTPDNDGSEDIFQAFTNDDYEVGIIDYRIYDRWGELIFISGSYSIHTEKLEYWWDGYFRGKPAEQAVYVYLIKVRHPDNSTEVYSGDVTLLR